MAFDVFAQGFSGGDASAGGWEQFASALGTWIAHEAEDDVWRLVAPDGEADLYHSDDSVMATHLSGEGVWDALVVGARAANWVIMPVGCPVCLTDAAQLTELPAELRGEVAVVMTGADLLEVIRSS